jgi:membrane-associated phospholipid phosphatase
VYQIIKKNAWFLIPYLVVGLGTLIIILLTSKSSLHLAINQFHTRFLDGFMPIITFLGNGLFACGLIIVLLLIKIKYSLYMLTSFTISGLIVQLLKLIIYPHSFRPVLFLYDHELHLVQGVNILHHYSFPSGHATTAFAVFFICSHLISLRVIRVFMLMLAILVAFSRTYLSLHFLEDILTGSFIGTVVTIASIYLTDRIKKEWTGKALLSLSHKKDQEG